MIFVIRKSVRLRPGPDAEPTIYVTEYDWTLHKSVMGTPTDAVARSVQTWPSEADARSAIAEAKIALKGARFAKVLVDP